ncbi:MAG: cell division protein FtsA [Muribaculaceae bacterium]|nr:cell division protein FtsA [Muribaculaceae bacterium]MDE6299219.1 cell division protein FtsA [Muribaculaceae bacterium]
MSERYIAAVEISSSKIIAAVGKTAVEGQLDVIAVEQESHVDIVRYGIIHNLEETSVRLMRLINRLEQRTGISPRKIKGVYVGLSGRSLKSISTTVELNLPLDTEITDDIIAKLRSEAMRRAVDSSLEVVDAVPRIYKVGHAEMHNPKGTVGSHIDATYDLVVCRPEIKRNLTRTITEKLGLRIEGFVVTALATGHLILSADEKRLGCLLADIGAETTTVTLYRKGYLRYFATLPLGGRNITRDITSLSVLEEHAEDIKITSGNAVPHETMSTLNLNGIKLSDVNNLVVARSEEIVANVIEQIEYAGLKETDIPGGLICIGGGARLNGITELIHLQSGLPVRIGKLPHYVQIDDPKAANRDIIEVVSVMYAGATLSNRECLEEPVVEELPKTGTTPEEEEIQETPEPERSRPRKSGGWFEGISRRLGSLFSGPDDDSELME